MIVGGGAAGLNAALILGRARRRVLLCDEGQRELTSTQRRWVQRTNCRLIDGRLWRLLGRNGSLKAVEVEDGERLSCDALFLATSLRQTCMIAEALDCKIDKVGSIVVDDKGRTNIRGCYAAGDAVTNIHQVILAAASGVRAAVAICTDLLCEEASAITSKSR